MSRDVDKGWTYIHHVSHPLKLYRWSVSGLGFLSCARHVARSNSWEMNIHSRIHYHHDYALPMYTCTHRSMMTIFWRKRREIEPSDNSFPS
ncbi:hypothetical protein BJX96DRAFT_9123 [Aspergillus floccosus]